ncbi:hypothetical protein [Candidatus Sodalis pierantonius]|uniref:hypothetical protein n=1 Tax=Candidatus Sodalis pierantonii TaxID=1486991 RepID=UPI00046D6EBB|nr:hypothetical protein [Candidatus Sodalis pierantonius]
MSPKRISHICTAASRRVIDRLTRIAVSGGGLLVLLALLLIFCYLLWVVLPLFRALAVGVVTDLAAYSSPAASVEPPLSLAAPEPPSPARVPLAAAQVSLSAARGGAYCRAGAAFRRTALVVSHLGVVS